MAFHLSLFFIFLPKHADLMLRIIFTISTLRQMLCRACWVAVFTIATSWAATVSWVCPPTGDFRWSTNANWSIGFAPAGNDTVIFEKNVVQPGQCFLDRNATVESIIFRKEYTSDFDFNGNTLSITGGAADFRTGGTVADKNGKGELIFEGMKLTVFLPNSSNAHFPTIKILKKQSGTVCCLESGMLVDTLKVISGTLFCGEGLFHNIGALQTAGGCLDMASSRISVSGANVDLSGLRSFLSAQGTLFFTGHQPQQVLLPAESLSIHSLFFNGKTCVSLTKTSSQAIIVDSLTVNAGILRLIDSTNITASVFLAPHGVLDVPHHSRITILRSADFSGLDTLRFKGTLASAGIGVPTMVFPKADTRIAFVDIIKGKMQLVGKNIIADSLRVSTACTLSLGNGLSHTLDAFAAENGAALDFGTSSLRFTGTKLDLSNIRSIIPETGSIEFTGDSPQEGAPSPNQPHPSLVQNGPGGITFCGKTAQFFIPGASAEFPAIVQNGSAGTTVLSYGFSCNTLALSTGTLRLGNDLSYSVTAHLRCLDGGLDFGSSTIAVLADTVDLSRLTTLVPGSGTLSFAGEAGTQIFVPKPNTLHPNLIKARSGTVLLMGQCAAKKMWVSEGTFDCNNFKCSFTEFSAIGGNLSVGRDSIIISGNALFSGLIGFVTNSGPVVVRASGNNPVVFFSSTAHAIQNLVLSVGPTTGPARIVAVAGTHLARHCTFEWNRCGDSAIFDFRQNNGSLFVYDSADARLQGSGSDKNCIYMGNGEWVFKGNFALSNYARDGSRVVFSRDSGAQTISAPQPLFDVFHSGRGSLRLGSNVKCRNFLQTDGVLDFIGHSLNAENDIRLLNGADSSIARSPQGFRIVAGRNASFYGSASQFLILSRAPACTIDASGSLTAQYSKLVNCFAVRKKGTAYNSVDSMGNSGWTLSNKPPPPIVLGARAAPRLAKNPDTIAFDFTETSSSAYRTIALKNTGGDTLKITQISRAAAGDLTPDSLFTLWRIRDIAPDDSCIDTIRFFPKKPGVFSAIFLIIGNSATSPDTLVVLGTSGFSRSTGTATPLIPKDFSLDEVTISGRSVLFKYGIPAASRITLDIYNAIGRILERPLDAVQNAREYQFTWDGSHLSRGIYFCRFKASDPEASAPKFIKTERLVFSK
jgi:hypothetical protein